MDHLPLHSMGHSLNHLVHFLLFSIPLLDSLVISHLLSSFWMKHNTTISARMTLPFSPFSSFLLLAFSIWLLVATSSLLLLIHCVVLLPPFSLVLVPSSFPMLANTIVFLVSFTLNKHRTSLMASYPFSESSLLRTYPLHPTRSLKHLTHTCLLLVSHPQTQLRQLELLPPILLLVIAKPFALSISLLIL